MNQKFTKEQVQAKNTKEGLWIIIDDKVYDLTAFLIEHPGGEDILIEYAGTDATDAFIGVGHSGYAKKLLNNYQIGIADEHED